MKTKKSPTVAVRAHKRAKPAAPVSTVAIPSGVVVAGPTDPEKIVYAQESASHVRFFRHGDEQPFSVLHNGPAGSENAAKVAEAMKKFTDEGFQVVISTP